MKRTEKVSLWAFLFGQANVDRSFLKKTAEVWQPHYKRRLTEEDAREIAENLTGFFDLLAEWEKKEKESKPHTLEVSQKAHEHVKVK